MKVRTRNLVLIALAVVLVVAMATLIPMPTDATKFIQKDIERDHARFTPTESVDIAMAMRMVTHDPPKMLAPPSPVPPQLLFPPSAEDLARLSG